MRRTASSPKPPKSMVAQGVPLPAPVGGWDAISPLANMPVDRAVQLDNWICRPGWIEPRNGYILQGTGLGGSTTPVQTIMAYNGLDGSSSLFGVAGGIIYDCTIAGAATATSASGLSNSRLQYIMFASPSNNSYLMTANGQDAPWSYDGSTWAQRPIVIGYATGSISWSQNFINGEQINLNGTAITFVAGTPVGNQIQIGVSLAASMANLLAFLSASTDANITEFTYSLNSYTLMLTAAMSNVAGNDLTIQAGYASGSILFASNPSNGDTITLNGTTIQFLNNVTSYATGTIIFSANPSNGDNIILQGTVVEFVASGATGNQVNIGGSLSVTLASLLTFLQASTAAGITDFTYSTASGTTLILTAAFVGIGGNALTFSASNATTSGPTLSGGSSGIAGSDQVAIGTTLADTLSVLLTTLENSSDGNINTFTYKVTGGNTLAIQAASAGVLGNSLTLAASVATVSGPLLIGGSTAAASGTNLTGGGDDYGIISSDFIGVNSYMNRLWFVPVNSTNVVYLQTVYGVQGSASVFPLGQLLKRGGYIMAIGTWTVDTRQSVDEYIAFISSRGEVVVYEGTDPTTANTFSLAGIYQVGAPVGRRCFLRISGDLQIITVDGVVGMSEMLSTDRAAANRVSLTSIIMNQMALSAQSYKNNFGWQLQEYALGTLAILNIPIQENSQQMQFVMNTITGAWSRFIGVDATGAINASYGINANCWEVDASDRVFFGGNDGTVYQWNVGSGDGANPITCVVKGAFNSFGNAAQLKRYMMLQPLITTTGNPIPAIGVDVDFNSITTLSTEEPISSGGATWGSVNWGAFTWGAPPVTTNNWIGITGMGHYVSVVTQITTYPNVNNPQSKVTLQLNGWNILAESGAYV